MRTVRSLLLPATRTARLAVSAIAPRHVAVPWQRRRTSAFPSRGTATFVERSEIAASTALTAGGTDGAGGGGSGAGGGGSGRAAVPATGPIGGVRPTPAPPSLAACTSHRIERPTSCMESV